MPKARAMIHLAQEANTLAGVRTLPEEPGSVASTSWVMRVGCLEALQPPAPICPHPPHAVVSWGWVHREQHGRDALPGTGGTLDRGHISMSPCAKTSQIRQPSTNPMEGDVFCKRSVK